MIDKAISDRFKQEYLYGVLKCDDLRSASALHTYAAFLNKLPQQNDLLPLYLKVFQTNNQYAVDALLKDKDPWVFFDFVRIANPYVVDEIFVTFNTFKRNLTYHKTLQVFCRLLKRLYGTGRAGYDVYPLSIHELNSLAKYLDESKGQSDALNREILDILIGLSDLDRTNEVDISKSAIGKQASRIRSDFLDDKRTLHKSFPDLLLERDSKVDLGIQPDTHVAE